MVGLLGYGIGVGLAALFGWRVAGTELAFFTWWPILPVTAVAIVLICVLSSLICIMLRDPTGAGDRFPGLDSLVQGIDGV